MVVVVVAVVVVVMVVVGVVVVVVVVAVLVVVVGSWCVCRRTGWCDSFAETRVLALCSPGIELCFCFRIGLCVLSFPVSFELLLLSMCRTSHRFLGCLCRLSTFRTCLDLRLSFSVRGWGGWGGVMTSMRMRLVSSVSFVALLLKCCLLLCAALVAASCCFTY